MSPRIAFVVALLFALDLVAPCWADEPALVTVQFRILAEKLPKPREPIQPSKYPKVFNEPIPNESLLVDPGSRGIANVFVWIPWQAGVPQPEPKTHEIVATKRGFQPHALVVRRGDKLQFRNALPVDVNPNLDYPGRPFHELIPAGPNRSYEFTEGDDKLPRLMSCTVHPWFNAYVFIADKTDCRVTDRLGECTFQIPSDSRKVVPLKVWQERSGYARPVKMSDSVTIDKSGKLSLDLAKAVQSGVVELTLPILEE